jgi:hypothetical protein
MTARPGSPTGQNGSPCGPGRVPGPHGPVVPALSSSRHDLQHRSHAHRTRAAMYLQEPSPPTGLRVRSGLHRHARLPLRDIRDQSSQARDTDLLICVPEPGTTPERLRDQLMDIYGVYTTVSVALPTPLATMLRRWAEAYATEDLLTSLTALEKAIQP